MKVSVVVMAASGAVIAVKELAEEINVTEPVHVEACINKLALIPEFSWC